MAYFGKATKAKEENNKQTATEIIALKITNAQMQSYKEKQQMPNLQYLADRLYEDKEIQYVYNESQKQATKEKIKVNGKSIFTKLEEYPYEFEIDEKLRLASINGIKISDTNNSNDILEEKITEIQIAMKNLQSQNSQLSQRLENLENETIINKRIKLMDIPVSVPLEVAGWKDGNFADIPLSDSIENYKYLEIQYDFDYGTERDEKTIFIATEQLKNYNNSNNLNDNNENSFGLNSTIILGNPNSVGTCIWCWFKTERILHVGSINNLNPDGSAFKIRNIYGIK